MICVYKPAPIGERIKGFERRVPAQIVKLYRNHALCAVNGKVWRRLLTRRLHRHS